MNDRPSIQLTLSLEKDQKTRIVTQRSRVTLELTEFRASWSWSPERPINPLNRGLPGWRRVY